LRLPPTRKTGSGAVSTSEEALLDIQERHEIIPSILEYRTSSKLRTTFLKDSMVGLLDKDQRIHTHYKITGTTTGRLASSGPNLQNIPRDKQVRNIFTVPENYLFLEGDYSQAELRVAAYASKDTGMISMFESGQDVHTLVATQIFTKPAEQISKEERILAKFLDFGIGYGRGWKSVADQYNKSEQEAKDLVYSFHRKFPALIAWFEEETEKARRDRVLTSCFGRKRWFPVYGDFLPQWEREARNFNCQSTIADLTLRSTILLDQFFRSHSFRTSLIMNLHDAIMLEVHRDELDDVRYCLQRIMEIPCPQINVSIPIEYEISDRWKGAPYNGA